MLVDVDVETIDQLVVERLKEALDDIDDHAKNWRNAEALRGCIRYFSVPTNKNITVDLEEEVMDFAFCQAVDWLSDESIDVYYTYMGRNKYEAVGRAHVNEIFIKALKDKVSSESSSG